MASHSGVHIVDLNEVRIARDGLPYTFLQFINYYGSDAWYAKWKECDGSRNAADYRLVQSHSGKSSVVSIYSFPYRFGAHAEQ